jgi:hypothetical protein
MYWLGKLVGYSDGIEVGSHEGETLGSLTIGLAVGIKVGPLGEIVGNIDGLDVVGLNVGIVEGRNVGE